MWPHEIAVWAASFAHSDYYRGLAVMLALFVYYGLVLSIPALIGGWVLALIEKRNMRVS